MNQLFIAWQDEESRRWFPIGSLTLQEGKYWFYYTQGVLEAEKESDFQPLPSFPIIYEVYKSEQLFPVFSNRVLTSNRPDYREYLNWLGLSADNPQPLVMLSLTEGKKATDNLQMFPRPVKNHENRYELKFFAHGIRHIEGANQKIQTLKPGDALVIDPDPKNKFDSLAIRLLSDSSCVGYIPRYLVTDIHKLINQSVPKVYVDKINLSPAPTQFRLLCELTAPWPQDFQPFADDEFKPLSDQGKIAYLTLAGSLRKPA